MEKLLELMSYCEHQKEFIEVALPKNQESPIRKLYEILLSGKAPLDFECMMLIYGRKNVSAFSNLKNRMRDILFYAISFREENEFISTELDGVRFLPFNEYYTAKALMTIRAFDHAAPLVERSIKKFIKHQRTQQVLWMTEFAVIIFGTELYNRYKFNLYRDIQEEYLDKYLLELKTTNFYIDIQRMQIRSVTRPAESELKKIKLFIQECDKKPFEESVDFRFNYYRISAFYYEYKKDYESLFRISIDTMRYFKSLPVKRLATQLNITVRLYWVMIQNGMLDEVIQDGINEMNNCKEGIGPWYRMGHYIIKAYIYKNDYLAAISLTVKLIKHKKFETAPEYYREIFLILSGYLQLIIKTHSDENLQDLGRDLPHFKLGKLLNTTPVFSKDKRGINISIILLHIAWLLLRKDFDAILDRTEALTQYAYRHLRRDDTFRSNCMIRMVIQMAKADFHPIRTARYTEDLRRQLAGVPLLGSGESIEIEMIPFEVLWDIMMASLRPAA